MSTFLPSIRDLLSFKRPQTLTNDDKALVQDKIGVLGQGAVEALLDDKVDLTDPRLSDTRDPNPHGHEIGDVANLQTALDAKLNTTDPSVTNARDWTAPVVTQQEAEEGTLTDPRKWTPQRDWQAIAAWALDFLAPLRPKVITQPVDVSGIVGDSRTLTTLAETIPNTDLSVTYQWLISTDLGDTWTPLSGATLPSLVFNPLLKANEGLYRCDASNSFGPRESDEVSVTVDNSIRHLFGVSDRGIAWDLDRMDHLFQLSNGTTSVTAYGDPVGLILTVERGGLDQLGIDTKSVGTIGIVGSATAATYNTSTGVGQVTNVNGSNQSFVSFAGFVVGRIYRIEVTNSGTQTITLRAGGVGGSGVMVVTANSTVVQMVTALATSYFLTSNTGSNDFTVVSIREVPGSHINQGTSSRRPTYARKPKVGVRNLLQRTEEFENAYWTKARSSIVANSTLAPDGTSNADKLLDNTENNTHSVFSGEIANAGTTTRTLTAYLKAAEYNFVSLYLGNNTQTITARCRVNILSGQIVSVNITGGVSITNPSAIASDVGNGWWKVSLTATIDSTITSMRVSVLVDNNVPGSTYVGTGTSGIFLWGLQLETGSIATPYQKVANQFDVTESGVQDVNYLWFDGIDDCMVSATAIDFTNSDEMTVAVGFSRSGTTERFLLELSAGGSNGMFAVWAPNTSFSNNHAYRTRGTIIASLATTQEYLVNTQQVVLYQSKISTDMLRIRPNGVTVIDVTNADQGTGNYGNHVLNVGSRNQTSSYYSGQLNSGFIINRLVNPTILTDYEKNWVAAKSGVTLP